jgi:cytochrome subunit of sulfide dehydrogenase
MKHGVVVFTLLALMASGPSMAAEDAEGRSWAATCSGCHGTTGRSEGGIPSLIGLQKAYIVMAMREFRDGARTATVMHQLAKGYTDEQVERIADYFASQKLD